MSNQQQEEQANAQSWGALVPPAIPPPIPPPAQSFCEWSDVKKFVLSEKRHISVDFYFVPMDSAIERFQCIIKLLFFYCLAIVPCSECHPPQCISCTRTGFFGASVYCACYTLQ